jgi:hypothetical protein
MSLLTGSALRILALLALAIDAAASPLTTGAAAT